MEESAKGEQRDRLSELPDSIILHILSLLPIRDVISTTFLSRRWNKLWATVPCLNFTDMDAGEDDVDFIEERVRNFVNRALLFWKRSKVLEFKLSIDCDFDKTTLATDVDLWLRFAVDNNVEKLFLDLKYTSDPMVEWEDLVKFVCMPPQCLYSCSSITELTLAGCNLEIHGSPSWNHLKTLVIDGYFFSEDLISRIILGCPMLEDFELVLMESNEDLDIQSTSLKKLQIYKYLYDGEQPSLDTKLRIWCPNLKILYLFGNMYSNYCLENVSSLSDATLKFDNACAYVRKREDMLTNLRDLFSALEHVERVALSETFVELLSSSENLPRLLPNAKFINLCVRVTELETMVNLLASSPTLKMLVIEVADTQQECTFIDKPLESEDGLSTYSFPQLSKVEIHAYIDNQKIFQFIVFLLNHCSMLQKLVICANDVKRYPPEFMFQVAGELLSLQRSFPTTQVILNKLT